MRNLKLNYEIITLSLFPPLGSQWNITGKKEHNLSRDVFKSHILPLLFNMSNSSVMRKYKDLISVKV